MNKLSVSDISESLIFQGVPSMDESDFEERILRHFAAAKSLTDLVNRRRRQSPPEMGPSQVSSRGSVGNASSMPEIHDYSEENKSSSYGVEVGLPASVPPASSIKPELPPDRRDGFTKHR